MILASVSVNGNTGKTCPPRSFADIKDQMVGKPRPVKWLNPTCIISVSLLNGSSTKLCNCLKEGRGALTGIIGQERWRDACSRSIIYLALESTYRAKWWTFTCKPEKSCLHLVDLSSIHTGQWSRVSR